MSHHVRAGAAALLSLLAACGGGGGDAAAPTDAPAAATAPVDASQGAPAPASSPSSSSSSSSPADTAASADGSAVAGATEGAQAAPAAAAGTSRQDAFRLLTQASFGPTDAEVAKVMASGPAAWVDAQLALPSSSAYLSRWDAQNKAVVARNPNASAGQQPISSQFFQQAIASGDQLRLRVGYALSQIFVVSTQGLSGDRARAVAAYLDMLDKDALGNYRTLLQDVALHPAMGIYLSSVKNQKENPATGQVPDQNFAREVMQLMSIGLSQLNADGTRKLGAGGAPIDTYTSDDIVGLSKVFTGFSFGGPDTSNNRFMGGLKVRDPNFLSLPMQAYPQFHSTSAKSFLGVTIAPQATPNPNASLKVALDTLFKHPNVGPFIGRQLIQRLVTSHPSDAYVGRVSAVFANNGAGVRGDLKAVVRAILLDPEARSASAAAGDAYGKVREPLLRVTAWMRAFNARSLSGAATVAATDDPGLSLAQGVGRSPSVFNFYRPGYVAPDTETGARGLTMPELQITTETSVAGYVNTMATSVARGFGVANAAGQRDVQADYTGELALAGSSAPLVDRVAAKLLGDGVPDAFKAQVRAGVDSIAIPALKANQANQAQVDAAKRNRVYAAVLLTLAAPEFIVQK